MITPIIKGLVDEALKGITLPPQVDINKIIDDVIASEVVDKILTNEFTQQVLERTIQYAVSDIMDIIKIPTASEIVETSKEELIIDVVESVWNSTPISILNKFEINPYHTYEIEYKYNIIPVAIKSTGWNRTSINIKVQSDLLRVVGENTQTPDLSSIDYQTIVKNAAKRAVTDIVNEKITEVKLAINTAIQNKVNELKKEAEAAIKNTINSIVSKFPSWPRK